MEAPPPRPTPEQVSAWLDKHPDASGADVAREFGLPATTARRWTAAHRGRPHKDRRRKGATKGRTAGATTPAPRPSRAKPRVSVEDMAPQDRERIVGIVRDVHVMLSRLADSTRRYVEAAAEVGDEPPKLDRDTAQAALNLQRMAASLIDSHPGLLELAAAGEDKAKGVGDEDLNDVLAALGID